RQMQQAFVSAVLPRVERHARAYFRHLRCPQSRQDAVAEAVALAWKWFLSLCARGKDVARFVSVLAGYAARHARAGRARWGLGHGQDAPSPRAQRARGFPVGARPQGSSLGGNVFDEALRDNTQTPVPEQVSFRLDLPAWLLSLAARQRVLAQEMMRGDGTFELAARHGLSPARISQLRRQLCVSWRRFCGEAA